MSSPDVFYLIVNVSEDHAPTGLFTLDTDAGPVLLVFNSEESAEDAVSSPVIAHLIALSGGLKVVVRLESESFERWFDDIISGNQDLQKMRYMREHRGSAWESLLEQLSADWS